jgi:thymidylate kinase
VLDSTIYQTVLTHRVLKSDTAKEYEIPDKLIPDLVIWLDCVESIRQIRVRGENRPPISDWDRALEANQSVLREGFDALHLPKVSTGGSFRQAQRGIHEVIARKLSL